MPEHTELALSGSPVIDGFDCVIDAEVLVVLRNGFDQPTGPFGIDSEVLDEVEHPSRSTRSPQHRFKRYDSRFGFIVDLLPLAEVLPRSRGGTHAAVGAVGDDNESVEPEELRNRGPVVANVVLVGISHVLVWSLEFEEAERNAVDKQDDVGALLVHVADHPQLRHRQPLVLVAIAPVNKADPARLTLAVRIGGRDLHSVTK